MLFGEIVTSSKSMRYPFNSIHPRLETPCRLCYTSSPQLIRGLNRSVVRFWFVIMSFLPWYWYVCVHLMYHQRLCWGRKTIAKQFQRHRYLSSNPLPSVVDDQSGHTGWRQEVKVWPHSSSMKASDSTKSFTHIHPSITTQDTVKYTKKMVLPLIAAFTSSLE